MDGPSGHLERAMLDGTGEGGGGGGGGEGGGSAHDETEQQLPPTTLLAAALMRNGISIEEGFAAVDVDQDGVLSLDDLMQVDPAAHNRLSAALFPLSLAPSPHSRNQLTHTNAETRTNTQQPHLHPSLPWTTDQPNTPTAKSHALNRDLGMREAWH